MPKRLEKKEIQTFFSVIFYPIFLYTLVQKYPEFIINLYQKKSILFMHHPLPELYVFLIIWIWVLRFLIYSHLLLPRNFFDEH